MEDRTTIAIPKSLAKRLRVACAKADLKLSAVAETVLLAWLRGRRPKKSDDKEDVKRAARDFAADASGGTDD